MRKFIVDGLIAAAGLCSVSAHAAAPGEATPAAVTPATTASASAKTKAHYTVTDTDLGTMLDDPVAKAILARDIPDIVNNPNIDMGRSMTLSQMQAYAGDTLTDAVLAKIQSDLEASSPS